MQTNDSHSFNAISGHGPFAGEYVFVDQYLRFGDLPVIAGPWIERISSLAKVNYVLARLVVALIQKKSSNRSKVSTQLKPDREFIHFDWSESRCSKWRCIEIPCLVSLHLTWANSWEVFESANCKVFCRMKKIVLNFRLKKKINNIKKNSLVAIKIAQSCLVTFGEQCKLQFRVHLQISYFGLVQQVENPKFRKNFNKFTFKYHTIISQILRLWLMFHDVVASKIVQIVSCQILDKNAKN